MTEQDPASTEGAGPGGTVAPPAALMQALRRILRPLVRLLLAQGVTYPYLIELLKSVFVEVAAEEFRLEGKRQTDSRISLLTGVHRKDVKRLGRERQADESAPAAVSLGAQLIALWTGMPGLQDESGRPVPLPRFASEGGERSFEGLVSAVSKDIRSRSVLDEWLRLNIVRLDEHDRVCLNVDAFIPREGYDEKAHYFGQNVQDHLAAAAHNLLGGTPPFLERSVHYDALSPESVAELARLSRELGMQALQAVNRRALELEGRDAENQQGAHRINFGIYFYSAPNHPESNRDDDS